MGYLFPLTTQKFVLGKISPELTGSRCRYVVNSGGGRVVGRRVQRESLNRRSGRTDLGSLPDLATVRHWPALTPIPHSDAMLLCRQKRHELAVMLERQEQRRRRTITLRLGDFQVDTFLIIIDAGRGHQKAAMHRPAVRPSVCLSVSMSCTSSLR